MSLNTTPDPQVHTSPTVEGLTPEREQEIRERRAAVSGTRWGTYRDLAEQYTVQDGACINPSEGFMSLGDPVALIVGDDDAHRYTRAKFIAQAPRDIDTLLAEIDRQRGELAEALRDKDWLDRHYARQIEESVQLRRELDQAQQQFNELSREASAVGRERDGLKERLHRAAMTKVWTNEDGKRFVFVEDIAPNLLGTTTETEGGGRDV